MIAVGIVTVIGTKRYESIKYTDMPESIHPGSKDG
jgi:hypothetical protein